MYLSKIGEPQGLAKNIRLCVCSAERDRTFEGVPIIDGGGGRRYKKIPLMQGFAGFLVVYCCFLTKEGLDEGIEFSKGASGSGFLNWA